MGRGMGRDRLKEMKDLSNKKSLKKKNRANPFLETIENISSEIDKAESNAESIKKVQKKIFNEPSERERKVHEADHNKLIEENKTICRRLQKIIKEEQKKIDNGSGEGTQERRIQLQQIQAVSQRYLHVWSKFNDVQIDFREKTKKRLLLSNKITNTEMTEEEVEKVLDNGGSGFYSACIVDETAKAKEDLNHLESRQEEFLKLERSIEEVADMFMELQTIVTMQKEMVDRIENNIDTAQVHVEKGKEEVWKAFRSKMAGRRRKCICVSLLIGGVVVVVLVVVVACLI